MTNSMKKGKRFEVEAAKILSKSTGAKWMRIPQSGATATTKGTTQFRGDLFTENDFYKHIIVECKSIKSFTVSDLFRNKSDFYKHLSQAEEESIKPDGESDEWLLLIKVNNQGVYACAEEHTLSYTNLKKDIVFSCGNWKLVRLK